MAHPKTPGRAGFTLVELMITIAVLAILTTLAAPSLAERLGRQRLESAAQTLAADLAQARLEAVSSGQTMFVVFDAGPDWCYAVARSADCGCGSPSPCQLKTERAADWPGVSLLEAEDARLEPAGIPGGAVQARFGDGSHTQVLAVGLSALGRARICGGDARWGYPGC
jgi:type IV fimbrial biogenesis protein FimT